MNTNLSVEIEKMEGRTFIIGKEGHIYIDTPLTSKRHAELKIIAGRIHLRDLNSDNGTYLVKKNVLVNIDEAFVNQFQPIMIGGRRFIVKKLLEIANSFAASDSLKRQVAR